MYRFHPFTSLAPLFSVLPLSAWLMLVAGTLIGLLLQPSGALPTAKR